MKQKLAFAAGVATMLVSSTVALAQQRKQESGHADKYIVRIAEIEIDPAQSKGYRAALQKAVEAAERTEAGVLALNAVSVKGHPEQIRVFEVYASQAAYQSHLQTPHFKEYKARTKNMVRSLKLLDTDTIVLASQTISAR